MEATLNYQKAEYDVKRPCQDDRYWDRKLSWESSLYDVKSEQGGEKKLGNNAYYLYSM